MPYIHKSTFEIIQGSNIDHYLDDYFEVDELIALPIQVLNRKGYTTSFCCSGHSFIEIDEAFSQPGVENLSQLLQQHSPPKNLRMEHTEFYLGILRAIVLTLLLRKVLYCPLCPMDSSGIMTGQIYTKTALKILMCIPS